MSVGSVCEMAWVAPAVGAAGGILAVQPRLNTIHNQRRYIERVQSRVTGRTVERRPGPRIGGRGHWYESVPGNLSNQVSPSMPTRLSTRLKRRKRTRRGGRGRKGRASLMWPRARLVRFKVVTKFSLTEAAGAVHVENLGANTLSDPHYALGGNLPLGLDQWAAMYKKYAVVGSRHYVKIHNVTSTGAVAYGLTLRQGGESNSLANAETYLETPMTRSRILSPDMDHSGLGISYSAKRYWRFRRIMDDDTQQAAFTTTPADVSRPAYVQFWFQDIHGGETCTMEGYVTSEYIALLFDPVTPSRSAV